MHPTVLDLLSRAGAGNQVSKGTNTDISRDITTSQQENAVLGNQVNSATGADEKICLSVVPVRVKAKDGNGAVVETYALLDSGSEVTLCHERLRKRLGAKGAGLNFTLSGMTGSMTVKSQLIDITVTSIDGRASVDLSNVRTVKEIPISASCIAKRRDVQVWSHLDGIELHELNVNDVMLVIGLQENSSLFIPLEYRIGGDKEPIGVKYSLGWTVIGPVGSRRDNDTCSTNFVRTMENSISYTGEQDKEILPNLQPSCSASCIEHEGKDNVELIDGSEYQRQNDDLNRKLEGLWKTDFEGSLVETKGCDSIEDKRALKVMETTLAMVDGHYQVALPWKYDPPYLPNNKIVALRRAQLLRKRLMKNGDLHSKYRETMNNYLDSGHAERVPKEELEPDDRPVWYIPHHPVVHPNKPEKVRIVYDCAATYKGTSLNQQLMSGPDQTNQLIGVLIRFREEKIGLAADIEAMFHQVLVEPKDRDVLRFLWWPNVDLHGELAEYRMIKHPFGATSSPSIANFCLRKTAELNSKEFDYVTIKTVKRNMYVDDLLKSTDTVEKAIRLVQQLISLLQKGGFV